MKRFLASVLAFAVPCCSFASYDAPSNNRRCFDCGGSNVFFLRKGNGFNYVSSHDYRSNVI